MLSVLNIKNTTMKSELKKIKVCRLKAGITLKELSVDAGCTIPELSRIERGLANPTVKKLTNICQSLGLKLIITNN